MSLPRLATCLCLLLLATTTASAQPSATAPPPAAGPVAEPETALLGTLRLWVVDDFAVAMVGAQYRRAVSDQLALTVDGATNLTGIEEDPLFFNAVFAGLKARLSPGTIRPYLGGRLGALIANDHEGVDMVGLWSVGGGIEASVGSSGLELDFGLGMVGAFGEEETVTEVSVMIGQRF